MLDYKEELNESVLYYKSVMPIEIKKGINNLNTDLYFSVDSVDDEDIANEARARDYIVLEKDPFNIIYYKMIKGQDITDDLRELIYNTIGRIL